MFKYLQYVLIVIIGVGCNEQNNKPINIKQELNGSSCEVN